jgi:hypothetical protein
MIDASLSFLVAAYTSFYMADRERIAKSVTQVPLMEGRSAISDNFCSDLIQEYNRQWNHNQAPTKSPNNQAPFGVKGAAENQKPLAPFDRKDILKNPQLGILQAYIDFIGNCKKRQAMENRIRRERGMGANEPVEIPPPGVTSSDWSDEEDESMFGQESNSSTDFFNEEQSNGDFSQDDATRFVSDQEDDNNNDGSRK